MVFSYSIGSPMLTGYTSWYVEKLVSNFLSKIELFGECWIWSGYVSKGGYGQFSVGRKTVLAHRFSHFAFIGDVADDLQVDHVCRNPSCVNPDHLQAITRIQNRRRGKDIIGGEVRTHCRHGHMLSAENVYEWRGKKACKVCRRNSVRKFRKDSVE